jgi:environmental stress-induced protein Ves
VVEPTDAGLEDFDWRLSMARVDADGPFSSFPEIDRVLMVRRGRYAPHMRRLEFERHSAFLPIAEITVLVCRTAGLQITHKAGTERMQLDDAMIIIGRESHPLQLSHTGAAMLCVVELNGAPAPANTLGQSPRHAPRAGSQH